MLRAPVVFLCHSHKDKTFVRALAKSLKDNGIGVWLDDAEILVGDSLVMKIAEAIDHIDFVVAVISPDSVSSSWVRYELEEAMTREIRGRRVVVLPVRLGECEMPSYLKHKRYCDFTDLSRYADSLESLLRSVLRGPRSQATAPKPPADVATEASSAGVGLGSLPDSVAAQAPLQTPALATEGETPSERATEESTPRQTTDPRSLPARSAVESISSARRPTASEPTRPSRLEDTAAAPGLTTGVPGTGRMPHPVSEGNFGPTPRGAATRPAKRRRSTGLPRWLLVFAAAACLAVAILLGTWLSRGLHRARPPSALQSSGATVADKEWLHPSDSGSIGPESAENRPPGKISQTRREYPSVKHPEVMTGVPANESATAPSGTASKTHVGAAAVSPPVVQETTKQIPGPEPLPPLPAPSRGRRNIQCRVADANTGAPVAEAGITFPDNPKMTTTTTDANGIFRARNVPVGVVTVEVSASRYKRQVVPLTVEKGKTLNYEFKLRMLSTYGTLAGTVVDAVTSMPVAARIEFPGTSLAPVKADRTTGTFKVNEVETGFYTMTATADKYVPATITLEVEDNKLATATFKLTPVAGQ